jgi:hypothetical protein
MANDEKRQRAFLIRPRDSFDIRHSDFIINDHVLIVPRIASAFSNVSLLPISSHFPVIWYVFTGLRV